MLLLAGLGLNCIVRKDLLVNRLLLALSLLGACAPNHKLRHGTTPPTWKYAADFTMMAAGAAVCSVSDKDATRAFGCGGALMIFLPYWLIDVQ